MRKAVLLYNARSGGRRTERQSDLQSALKILAEAGVAANLVLTQSSSDAAEQARKAILDGCDTVFACGGDGTIHDVLQAVAGSRVALGILPMGTANSLAHDLRLPSEPAEAVRVAIMAEPHRIAVGRVQVRGLSGESVTRYFTVAVGAGVDAHLFYKLNATAKQRLGMTAYYAKAWHLWFSHRMEQFVVEWSGGGESSAGRLTGITEMLAVRIRNFGGILQELAPGASLARDDFRVVLCCTRSRLSYLLYVIRGLLHARWKVSGVELLHSEGIRCDYDPVSGAGGEVAKVYVEADGELIGTLPAEVTIVRDALTILMPKGRR